MKKILLLSLASLIGVSLNAQNFEGKSDLKKLQPEKLSFTKEKSLEKASAKFTDKSYYHDANHERITFELNTLLGTTGSANGGFDTLGFYSETIREITYSGGNYWRQAMQTFPLTDSVELNSIQIAGKALNPSGSNVVVTVYKNDYSTILGQKAYAMTTAYNFKTITFTSPIKHNDTIIVALSMSTVADSFKIVQTHSIWEGYDFGTQQAPNVFHTALPFEPQGYVMAASANNATVLGYDYKDFDFLMRPTFAYRVKSSFTSSDADNSICLGDSISFTNSNTAHVKNPILNVYEWNTLADNVAPYYTKFIYSVGATPVLSGTQSGGIKYPAAGTYTAKALLNLAPWTSATKRDTATFVINVNALPAAPVITPNGSLGICSGGSVGLSSESASSYNWSSGATTQSITASTPGTYTVSITDANGCVSPNGTVNVTANPTQDASFSYVSNTLCVSGGTASATKDDPTLNGTFSSTSGLDIDPSTGLITPSNSTPAQYTVTYTTNSTSTSCTDTKTQIINITNSPVATFNYSAASYCNSESDKAVSYSGGGSAGAFSSDLSGLNINPNSGLINVALSTPGNYVVTNTINVSGCALTTATANVEIKATPTVTVSAPAVCAGSTATVTATPGVSGTYTYTWTVPSGTTPTTSSFNPTVAGLYSVVITNQTTGCTSQSANATLTINALPTVSVTAPAVCAGSTATVTATPGVSGTYTYAWTVPSGTTPANTVSTFNPTAAGQYSVVITNPTTMCSSQIANVTLTINPLPSAPVIAATGGTPTIGGAIGVCGGSQATISVSSPGAGTYAWSNSGTGNSITISTAATYTVTNTLNGCTSANSNSIQIVNCAELNENAASVFSVYPNPANEVLNIELNLVNAVITLVSSEGKVVETRNASNAIETLNVKGLNAGVYFLNINANNNTYNQKVIIK